MNERPGFLAMLADADRNAGAPDRVEQALRLRVRQKRGWERRRPKWTAGFAALAAAAAAWAAVVCFVPSAAPADHLDVSVLQKRFAPRVPAVAYVRPEAPLPAALDEYGGARPARRSLQSQEFAATPAGSQVDAPRRFYALAYAPPEMLANGRMVRVSVPRSALLSFGLPLDAYRPAAGKVDADVIFTEDGIARAIRFVPQY